MQQSVTQARPYARAAFEYARQHDSSSDWSSLLESLGLLIADEKVSAYLTNPKVSPQQAMDLFTQIFTQQLDSHLQNFLRLLADARELQLLPEIANLFAEYEAEYLQMETVHVTAAKKLSATQQKKLNVALTQRLQKKVQLDCTVDPELLGGVMIRTDKWMIDGSVKGKLEQLKTTLVG